MYQMSQGYASSGVSSNGSYTARSFSSLEQSIKGESFHLQKREVKRFVYAHSMQLQMSYASPMTFNSSTDYLGGNTDFVSYNASNDSYGITTTPHIEYHFNPNTFLKPGKHGTFVGKIEEIKEHIIDAFEKLSGLPFPTDLKLSILDEKEFRKIAPGKGTIGISFNRRQSGLISEIFVLNDTLARVMLTIGHELGHVLTPTLSSSQSEEAKAFAYSFLWMKILKEHNITGLADAFIVEQPEANGLHDVAYSFVQKMIQSGMSAKEVYGELIGGRLAVGM